MASRDNNISAKAQQTLGLPEGFKVYSPFPFDGIDQSASAIGVADNSFLWLENWIRIGDGNLRTAWDVGSAIYTATGGATLVYVKFYYLNGYYAFVVDTTGTGYVVNLSSFVATAISASGVFYKSANPTNIPFAKMWGAQYLLIINNNTTNDFWAWDGALLYTAGTVAPGGVVIESSGYNYSSAPTITPYGGRGTGLALTAVENGGAIVEINITNPGSGYQVGDNVQLAFSGGGSDTSAILTANLNASGVGGVSISAGGSGYTAATVAFSGGGGSGAAGSVLTSSGVTGVTVSAGGSGYTYCAVAFSGGGGSGAAGQCVITAGAVASVTITASGSGYTSAPTAAFSGDGSGATSSGTTISAGVITGVVVTNAGSGYTSAPAVAFSGSAGSGASGVALLTPSGVHSVSVTNGGSGFTSVPTLNFIGGGGAGAVATALLTPTSIASVQVSGGGSGYSAPPTVSFRGGNGSGAAAIAVLNGDIVSYVYMTNGGSGYTGPVEVLFANASGDTLGAGAGATACYNKTSIGAVQVSNSGSFYTSAPTVQVSTGANSSAYAYMTFMPFGVSGSSMDTYLSRLWILDPAQSPYNITPAAQQWMISAADSFTDFATSDGGVLAVNSDEFLQTRYVVAKQSSGYMYLFGDGSTEIVSSVSSTANSSGETTTSFNYQNVDPQAGSAWRDALQEFGRSLITANQTGVYGLYGGTLSKISAKLDNLFENAIFPPTAGAIAPSSAIAHIFNVKHYLLLMTVKDPDTNTYRNVMVTWNEKSFNITSQSVALKAIYTQKVGSIYYAYGTDGTKIYPLFNAPSSTLVKKFDTKQYGADKSFILKEALGLWMQASDNSSTQAGISGTFYQTVSGVGVQSGVDPQGQSGTYQTVLTTPTFQSPNPYFALWGSSQQHLGFVTMSVRFQTTSPDMTLGNFVIGYRDMKAFYA